MNTELLCKDCKHCRQSLLTTLFLSPSMARQCSLDWKEPRVDLVTGKTVPGYFYSCASTRLDPKICGPEALAWEPRTKHGLFKFLKHVR